MPSKQNLFSSETTWKFLLAGFVVLLLTATHIPPSSGLLPPEEHNIDKLYHFTAYTILAGLLATTWQMSSGILTARHLRWVWCAVAVFGALDELTQPPFQRDCSIWDWTADIAGAAFGIFIFVWLRRRLAARASEG